MTIPPHTLSYYLRTGLMLLPIMGAAVLGAVRYRHLSQPLRYLAWLAWFELPLEVVADWLGVLGHNNLFIMPIYTVGEFTLLGLVYAQAIQSAAFSRAMPWLAGGFATYTLLDNLLAPDLSWFKPGQQVLQSLLILSMVGLYFRQLLHELRVQRLDWEPLFWVSVGLALYFLGYLQISLFSNYMLKHYSLQFNRNIWNIHSGLVVLLHSCYCVAFVLRSQPRAASTAAEALALKGKR